MRNGTDSKDIGAIIELAELGNANALYKLGRCYFEGFKTNQNLREAFECFKTSANLGNTNAQLYLGYCYEYGKGTRKNLKLAFEWYEMSAHQGNDAAQTNLAYFYEQGIVGEKDYVKAAEWYTKAAEQGNARALNNLGVLYENGRGVDKKKSKAYELYSKSAGKGFIGAYSNIAYCFEHGIGVRQNYKKAAEYYTKAADKGNKYAKNALKRIKDYLEYEKWIKSLNFSTRRKIKKTFFSRVIPFGKNYIVRRNNAWGIVDDNENILLPIEYAHVHWFEGGFAGIQFNNKWGLVNSKGNITINPQYDQLHYLSQYEVCEVEFEGQKFVVDVNNNNILQVEGKNVRTDGDKLFVWSKKDCRLYNYDGTPFSKTHKIIT